MIKFFPSVNSFSELAGLLRERYTTAQTRFILVRDWMQLNDVGDYRIENLGLAPHLFEPVDDEAHVNSVLRSKDQRALDLKCLETAFEMLIDDEHKKKSGTVLTPQYIIDYLIRGTDQLRKTRDSAPTICDPACGYGGFLVTAANYICKQYSIDLREAYSNFIFGFDSDSDAVAISKLMMALHLLQRRFNPELINLNVRQQDTLGSEVSMPRTNGHASQGFDVIATNPPYVKLQNIPQVYRLTLQKQFPRFTNGSYSTAMLFLVSGYEMLAAGGCLGYITQNNIFTSLAGQEVRKYLVEKRCISRIVDFGHLKLFPNASAYTCLTFLVKDNNSCLEYSRVNHASELSSLHGLSFSRIPYTSLQPRKWRLVEDKHSLGVKRLESVGTPLGEMYSLRVGFATLKDRVFFANSAGSLAQATAPDGALMEIEKESCRPAIKIAEFDDEAALLRNTRLIIYPYLKANGKMIPVPENEFSKRYPKCYEYLRNWKEELSNRDKGSRQINPWYAWGRSQSLIAPGPKLLTKTFSNRPNFLLDTTDALFCNGYGLFERNWGGTIFEKSYSIESLKYILNSVVLNYYLRLTSFQIEGNFQCYQKNFIERFALPHLESTELREIIVMSQDDRDRFLCGKYSLEYSLVRDYVESTKASETVPS